MASTKCHDIRWVRRYRIWLILGGIILCLQVFLAYIFLLIYVDYDDDSQDYRDLLSGRGSNNEISHPRDDYRELLLLSLVFLGCSPTDTYTFKRLGAMHHARWMSKAIYSLKMFVFRDQFHLSSREIKSLRQVLHEDVNGAIPFRHIKENYLGTDDEDSPSNSNLMNSVYSRQKVPPDKHDTLDTKFQGNKVPHITKYLGTFGPNLTILRLEELDFVPACEIVTKDAIIALNRAKTQSCKQTIVNITCIAQQNRLYPERLPNTCPSEGFTPGKSLGCFKDKKTFRLLTGYFSNLKTTNSPQQCINMCLQSGFTYAGVQYSTECFCGNEEPPSTSRLPDSSCNMKCPADPKEACGGYFTINIYETGITKFTPQVAKDTPEQDAAPIRIAYLLTLNGRALRQVHRLIKMLYHRDHFFYIHVDARQDYLYRELLPLERFPNIRLARKRFATIWGGASLLQMLLISMSELLKLGWDWDFIINLSESDFPIKSNSKLVDFLTANKGKNFVKSHGREVQRFIQKQGLDKTFIECDAHMWRTGDRVLPWGLQMDGGSDWVALSRSFVTYVTSVVDNNSSEKDKLLTGLVTVFKHTLLPAESFFHTVLRNSRFCNTYIDNNLHSTNWKRRSGCKCQYKHIVDWCGCSPNDYKMEDWPRIQATETRQQYFARKFEPIVNQAIIEQVEEWLYEPYPIGLTNLKSYWQSVYHHADLSPPTDDALVTLATSISRHATRFMSNAIENCSVSVLKVQEVTSYHHYDSYKGTLILYEVLINSEPHVMRFETWAKPEQHQTVVKSFGPFERLKIFYVSSDFDQKEQISRNFLRVLGPFSEPVIIYQFLFGFGSGNAITASDTLNVTLLWMDPAGELVDVSETHVEDNSQVNHIKSSLNQPILPGVWQVMMIYNDVLVAQTQFLILPLQFMSGAKVSQKQAEIYHSGSSQIYTGDDAGTWEKFLPSSEDRRTLLRKSVANSKKFDVDLRDWIDNLTIRFYRILESCVVSSRDLMLCHSAYLEPCESMVWSSLSPDPKSRIKTVNNSTGRLNRW